jgi:hypothetical protein
LRQATTKREGERERRRRSWSRESRSRDLDFTTLSTGVFAFIKARDFPISLHCASQSGRPSTPSEVVLYFFTWKINIRYTPTVNWDVNWIKIVWKERGGLLFYLLLHQQRRTVCLSRFVWRDIPVLRRACHAKNLSWHLVGVVCIL